jgi:paraquat-inducible protein B
MSKPANKTMIGVFVLGAVALVVIAVVAFGSGKFFKKTIKGVCYFEGSVGGLGVGAPVVFRGVKVGMVKDINLRYDASRASVLIPVYIELEKTPAGKGTLQAERRAEFQSLIEKGLRARLEMQSIVTGQLQIAFDFYPEKPARYIGVDPDYLEFPTIPTPLQEITRKIEELPLEEIIRDISAAVSGINRVINSPEIGHTLESISEASKEARGLIQTLHVKVGPAVSNVEMAAKDAEDMIRNMDNNLGLLVSSINNTVKDVQRLVQNVDSQVQPLSTDVQETLGQAKVLFQDIDVKATTLISNLDATIKHAQELVHNINIQIDTLGPSIQKTLASIEKTSNGATATLQQAQQTLVILGEDIGEDSELIYELKRAVKEIGSAVKSIQVLANTLEQQPESVIFGKKRKVREVR